MKHLSQILVGAAALASVAHAQNCGTRANTVTVNADITTSTTWTNNNVYNLQRQIYVRPGATLTIQAGTVIASTPTANGSGSLAVTRGARIIAEGTDTCPVIFTSTADVATWTGGNPRTGQWREAANEWGNLTIMGRGYVSSCLAGNTAAPSASNRAAMEGLVAAFPNDPDVEYGGGNDDDDSGSLTYVSIRYGGRVVGLGNELNGLSLGGIGRETDIHHVEVMNNVDDGIEIWGGTVNLKHVSIWNVGDDSIDIDQGWRGKIQFPFIVQGYSVDAVQGSGVGDNCFETDGAEGSDYQPVTSGVIYNATVVGQPVDGDHGTAWRDNCRMQYRNCIFMDLGERLVGFDNNGDHACGALGYGANGTLSWAATWTTPYSSYSTVNAPSNPAAFYRAQTSGNLNEIKDSVCYNNVFGTAYTEANARGVFGAANNNVLEPATMPIASLTRGPQVIRGSKAMVPVTSIDPRPAGAALSSVDFAPRDGFFCQAKYRGAFNPCNLWLSGWSAAAAYGFIGNEVWTDLGQCVGGSNGCAVLCGAGTLVTGSPLTFSLRNAPALVPTVLVLGVSRLNLPVFGGTLVPSLDLTVQLNADASGNWSLPLSTPFLSVGTVLTMQAVVFDPTLPSQLGFSNALAALKR